MRIAISGSHGLIGGHLYHLLSLAGHEVLRLVRNTENWPNEIAWDPHEASTDLQRLERLDAIVNLAGENISAIRWTEQKKNKIFESRVKGAELLTYSLKRLTYPPKVIISASAVGFYGDTNSAKVDELGSVGRGFLPFVCRQTEASLSCPEEAPCRIVNARFGVVLSSDGGLLQKLTKPFSGGLGAILGTGEQWFSWVSIDDCISALIFCLENESISGPVNITSPEPVTNLEFSKCLAETLGRRIWLKIPSKVLTIAMGEIANELLLRSTRAIPVKLCRAGFQFKYPSLPNALEKILAGKAS